MMKALAYDRSSQRLTAPHLGSAVPSANVSVNIYDGGGTSLLGWTAATKGSFSTSITAAAAAGSGSLTVGSLTGLTYDEPIVIAEGGQTELVVAKRFSGTTVTLQDPTARAWTTAATIKSALVYYDADFSAETTYPTGTYYQVAFRSTSWKDVRAQVFRIVDWRTTNPITYEQMRKVLTHIAAIRDGHDEPDLDAPRELAWKQIKSRITADGRDPDVMRDTDEVKLAGGYLAAALFVMGKANGFDKATSLAGDPIGSGGLFELIYQSLTKIPLWFDGDQDHGRDEDEMQTPASNRMGRGM